METENTDKWLAAVLPKHRSLTKAVVTITESLLKAGKIDYLAVTGRTKTLENIKEKVRRKSYKHPRTQMTDISGVRVIVYFESDVRRVSDVIESSFRVDKDNSLDKEALLAADQNGYRPVHYARN